MTVLLVSPPVGNFAQVHPAICLLTRYLRHSGFAAIQMDTSISCFHHYHSAAYLTSLLNNLERDIDLEIRREKLDADQVQAMTVRVRLSLLLEQTINSIESAKREMRRPEILDDPRELARCLTTIKDVGRIITAIHSGQEFSFQNFKVREAFDDWQHLRQTLDNPERNLLLEYIDSIELRDADLLGVSVTYPAQLLPALCLAKRWRREKRSGRIVFGGSYLSTMIESFRSEPRWFDFFDFIVMHDGEEALCKLADTTLHSGDVTSVPNLLYRENNEVKTSTKTSRTSLRDLPTPMLDFDGINPEQYLTPHQVIALPISRGCYWGKCTFCNISNQTTDPYRVRPTSLIVEDIRALSADCQTPYFDFCVDSFHPRGLEELSNAIMEAGLQVFWNAEVLLDPEFTRERLEVMAASGCKHLRFGLESVNGETLSVMDKRNDLMVVKRIIGDCRAYDIKVSLMSIIGFPTESAEQAWNTLNFYLDQKDSISFVTLHRFNVAAGSPLMHRPELCGIELVRRAGLLQPSFDYINLNAQGIPADDVPQLVSEMEEVIRSYYPQHAEIHTVGIGGWLTFLACCNHEAGFFKTSLAQPSKNQELVAQRLERREPVRMLGAFRRFSFDVNGLETAARSQQEWQVRRNPSCVMLNPDRRQIHILPPTHIPMLQRAQVGDVEELPLDLLRVLVKLGLMETLDDHEITQVNAH